MQSQRSLPATPGPLKSNEVLELHDLSLTESEVKQAEKETAKIVSSKALTAAVGLIVAGLATLGGKKIWEDFDGLETGHPEADAAILMLSINMVYNGLRVLTKKGYNTADAIFDVVNTILTTGIAAAAFVEGSHLNEITRDTCKVSALAIGNGITRIFLHGVVAQGMFAKSKAVEKTLTAENEASLLAHDAEAGRLARRDM